MHKILTQNQYWCNIILQKGGIKDVKGYSYWIKNKGY